MAASSASLEEARRSCDWFEHTLGWWAVAAAHPSQVLFVTYESLLAAPLPQVRRVAQLIAPELAHDEAKLADIVAASSFGAMKARHEADPDNEALRNAGEHGHFRKGVAGDWKNHLSEAQARRFTALMRERLEGTGLEHEFPP